MAKKYVKLIAGVVLIIVLGLVYFFLLSDNDVSNEVEEGQTDEQVIKLIDGDRESSDVSSVVLKNGDVITELIPNEQASDTVSSWVIKGYENIELNKSNTDSFVESMISISSRQILNADNNLAQYGLDKLDKSITIKFNDDTESVIYLGTSTADGSYYYAKKSDSDNIYLVDSINGKRITYSLNDFIDKTVAQISPYSVMELNIKRKGKEEIDLEYTTDKSGNAENLISMGMETMNMKKPYAGMAVYPTNLQDSVLSNITDFQLGNFVAIQGDNLAQYGLDEPTAQIFINDGNNTLKVIVGNKTDDKNFYCIVNDKPIIFAVDEKYINPFINADPIKFVEKFVALHYRVDMEKVEMDNGGKKYEVTFGEEVQDTSESEEKQNSKFNDNRRTYINGKEVDKDTFADFCELLVGVTFDSVDESADASGKADVVIKYTLKDGTVDEVSFIPYSKNESFYVVNGKSLKGMLVSKQNVTRIFAKADEILK